MISDEEIQYLTMRHNNINSYGNWQFDVHGFARSIERISRQRQRESDLKAIPSDKHLEQGDSHADSDRKIVWNNALHAAREAILANKEQP